MNRFHRRLTASLAVADHLRDRRARARARAEERGDKGFVLLESIVAISLITIIMSALASFFLNTMASTSQQRARQVATQLASSAVETIRGLHGTDVLTGHDVSSVSTQFAGGNANSTIQPWLATMQSATDPNSPPPGTGTTADIPTVTVNQTVNNIVYGVTDYIGTCVIPSDGSTSDCGLGATSTGITYLRAVVAVTWRDTHCTASKCAYVTSTLVSPQGDPTFNLNQTPPAVPIVQNPGNQTSAVNDTVGLQLAPQAGTGVPTFTWQVTAGALPAGLALSPAGLISGIPTTQVSNLSVTVTVTDAFLRTASATFTWTIQPPLVIGPPGNQAATTGSPVSALTLTATGGSGSGYQWSDPNTSLPPGLSISTVGGQGKVTGTPTAVGVYNVQLQVKDSTNTRTSTINFTWTITYPPIAATNPGAQTSTINTADSLQLTASGGSGSFVWTGGASLPAGLTMTSGGLITGTPTATVTKAVALTVTDTVTSNSLPVSFTWTIVAKPTIAAPGTQASTEGASPSYALAFTCPNQPCTISLTGTVPGLGLSTSSPNSGNNTTTSLSVSSASGTVYVNGTVQANAVTSGTSKLFTPSVTITDTGGATVTPAAGAWTMYIAPSVSGLATDTVTETGTENVPIAYTCANGSCTITLAGTVPGLGLNTVANGTGNNTTLTLTVGAGSGTVYLNGTVQNSAVTSGTSKAYTPSITIKDAANVTANTSATVTAYTVPTLTAISSQTGTRNVAASVAVAYTCPNATCTATVSGAPGGLGLNLLNTTTQTGADNTAKTSLALTGSTPFYINGKIKSTISTGAYTVTVKITDAGGVIATRSFTWTVS